MPVEISSYSGDPTSGVKDAIRFEIGDTDNTEWLLTDKEILYCYAQENSALLAGAARACDAISAKFAREADNALGPSRVSAHQKAIAYARRAATLRKRSLSPAAPYVGGLSEAERDTDEADTDLVQPHFKTDIHEPV